MYIVVDNSGILIYENLTKPALCLTERGSPQLSGNEESSRAGAGDYHHYTGKV